MCIVVDSLCPHKLSFLLFVHTVNMCIVVCGFIHDGFNIISMTLQQQ
uniref:Uncharacterized protein n=1 Tax=Anguilla anguilla TaxID=7936 RepID=A0A0E9XR89_ANGAN